MNGTFFASLAFQTLFLSPFCYVLLLCIAAFMVKRLRYVFFCFAALLAFLSSDFGKTLLLSPLEKPYETPQKVTFKPDAVVVLGGGANASSNSDSLSRTSFKRLVYGLALAKSKNAPLVFSGGGFIQRTGISEAQAARMSADMILTSYGFEHPLTDSLNGGFGLLLEQNSENTRQNAINTYRLFEKNGFHIATYAVDFRANKQPFLWIQLIPTFDSLDDSFVALREYIALIKTYIVDF